MKLLICTQVMDTEHPILGFFHAWVLEFAKHCERVDVICLEQGSGELPAHVHVHSLGKEAGASKVRQLLRFYRYFYRYGAAARPDVVFFHMGAIMNILAAPFYWLRGRTRYVWWKTHGHIDRQGRLALRFVDEVCTAVAESFPIDSPKRRVVGHAIDVERFTDDAPARTTDVLFVGRLSRSKRVEQVLRVTAALRAEHAVTARIIGAAVDTAYAKEVQLLARALELTDAVTFVPGVAQSKLVAEYQRAQVFINPSDNDGLDKVVLEAMACGALPLTGNVSFRELLTPYGLYMPKGDIAAYTARARELLALTPAARAPIAAALREEVVTHHSLRTLPARLFGV